MCLAVMCPPRCEPPYCISSPHWIFVFILTWIVVDLLHRIIIIIIILKIVIIVLLLLLPLINIKIEIKSRQ